jgi:hypothetical protein
MPIASRSSFVNPAETNNQKIYSRSTKKPFKMELDTILQVDLIAFYAVAGRQADNICFFSHQKLNQCATKAKLKITKQRLDPLVEQIL